VFTRVFVSALAVLASSVLPAGAVMLARLKPGPVELRLCPKPSCPPAPARLPGSKGVLPILEFSGPFGRIGPWMTREDAAAKYPGIDASKLPGRVAVWIARRNVTTGNPVLDDAAAALETEQPELPKSRTIVRPPLPERSPRMAAKPSMATADAGKGSAPAAGPQTSQALPLPAAAARIAATAPAFQPAPAAAEPAQPQEAFQSGGSETSGPAPVPAKLTPDLLDKRLKILPAKPDADYTMEQVVALRRQALAFLEQGACSGIREGGKTLTPGFLYIVCEGDEAWRQFPQ
jgi:hypothetical protein